MHINLQKIFSVCVAALSIFQLGAAHGWAQTGAILQEERDAKCDGYTVLKVWGTPYEMGYAQGTFFPQEIIKALSDIRSLKGSDVYSSLKNKMKVLIFKPASLEEELNGLVAGINAAQSNVSLDIQDLKVLNTYADWEFGIACRSHAAWGSFVSAPTRTLSTRQLVATSKLSLQYHHLIVAYSPSTSPQRF